MLSIWRMNGRARINLPDRTPARKKRVQTGQCGEFPDSPLSKEVDRSALLEEPQATRPTNIRQRRDTVQCRPSVLLRRASVIRFADFRGFFRLCAIENGLTDACIFKGRIT
jgi:hypothetical protein